MGNLLSVNKTSMVQTGGKMKQNGILLFPFHIILPEKHGDDCSKAL